MKEQPPVPCLMDFQKDCSSVCPLFGIACESRRELVEARGEGIITEIRKIISAGDAGEIRLFMASYQTLNAEKNLNGQCEQLQETERKNSGWFTSLS